LMNASILPGVIEMTGHYRGVLPGLPLGLGRPFLPINEIRSEGAANPQQTSCTLHRV
jgi:hypothetical protein